MGQIIYNRQIKNIQKCTLLELHHTRITFGLKSRLNNEKIFSFKPLAGFCLIILQLITGNLAILPDRLRQRVIRQ